MGEQYPAIILDYIHNLVASIWIGGIIFFVFAFSQCVINTKNTSSHCSFLYALQGDCDTVVQWLALALWLM